MRRPAFAMRVGGEKPVSYRFVLWIVNQQVLFAPRSFLVLRIESF